MLFADNNLVVIIFTGKINISCYDYYCWWYFVSSPFVLLLVLLLLGVLNLFLEAENWFKDFSYSKFLLASIDIADTEEEDVVASNDCLSLGGIRDISIISSDSVYSP